MLELNAKTSLGELRGSGSIGDPDNFLGSTFNVEVRAESLARLAGAYGIEGMPDKPAEIAGAAEYTADGIRTRGAVSRKLKVIRQPSRGWCRCRQERSVPICRSAQRVQTLPFLRDCLRMLQVCLRCLTG